MEHFVLSTAFLRSFKLKNPFMHPIHCLLKIHHVPPNLKLGYFNFFELFETYQTSKRTAKRNEESFKLFFGGSPCI